MDPLKNPGRFRKFLGKYNNYLVWLYCGVFAVAEADLIYKYYTGNAPKKGINHAVCLLLLLVIDMGQNLADLEGVLQSNSRLNLFRFALNK